MKKLTNNKDNNKAIMLIAESQDDWDILDTLYHDGIVFGAYMLYNFKGQTNGSLLINGWLNKNFPNAYGIMQISVVQNFANKGEDKLI